MPDKNLAGKGCLRGIDTNLDLLGPDLCSGGKPGGGCVKTPRLHERSVVAWIKVDSRSGRASSEAPNAGLVTGN